MTTPGVPYSISTEWVDAHEIVNLDGLIALDPESPAAGDARESQAAGGGDGDDGSDSAGTVATVIDGGVRTRSDVTVQSFVDDEATRRRL